MRGKAVFVGLSAYTRGRAARRRQHRLLGAQRPRPERGRGRGDRVREHPGRAGRRTRCPSAPSSLLAIGWGLALGLPRVAPPGARLGDCSAARRPALSPGRAKPVQRRRAVAAAGRPARRPDRGRLRGVRLSGGIATRDASASTCRPHSPTTCRRRSRRSWRARSATSAPPTSSSSARACRRTLTSTRRCRRPWSPRSSARLMNRYYAALVRAREAARRSRPGRRRGLHARDLGDHRAGPVAPEPGVPGGAGHRLGRGPLQRRLGPARPPDAGRPALGPPAPRERRRDGPLRVPGGRRHREHGHPAGGPQQAPGNPAAGERGRAPWPGWPDDRELGRFSSRASRGRSWSTSCWAGGRRHRVGPRALCYLCRGSRRLPAWSLVRCNAALGEALRIVGGDDGPSRFYLRWCESARRRVTPPSTGTASCAWTRSSPRAA